MITLHPNTNTDKNGNFSILKNIDNLEFVILEDSINNIPENYKKFIFIPGKRLVLDTDIKNKETLSFPVDSYINRLESLKVHNLLKCAEGNSSNEDKVDFCIDTRKYLINPNAIIEIAEVIYDKSGNILIEIAIRKLSGVSIYQTEYLVFELHQLNYNKFIKELTN